MRHRLVVVLLALVAGFTLLSISPASAQLSEPTRTVFVIGNINGGFGTFPLRAFNITDDTLHLAHSWFPVDRDGGPVGLGVDPINERMFVSYEFSNVLDVFDATDATPLGQIVLAGTSDLCGLSVHEGNGILYTVDRMVNTIYEFDTDTFAPITQWTLPTGAGPFDLEVVEDVDGQDLLFVTDATNTIRWYDLDTHLEVGNAYQSVTAAVGLGVYINENDYPVLFTGSVNQHGLPSTPSLVKVDTESGQTSTVNLGGGNVRGIAVNQLDGLVYAAVGSAFIGGGTLRVYDVETLTELTRAENIGASPTDCKSTWLAFGSSIQKTSTTHPDGDIDTGEEVTFEIYVENRNSRPLHIIPFSDEYDPTQLTFVSASITPDNVDDVNGVITWNDLVPAIGHDLAFEESYTFTITFEAAPDACENWVDGTNTVVMTGAEDDTGDPVDDGSGSMAYRIWCTCVVDEDCEDDVWCNGNEQCIDRECVSSGNPCPVDNGLFCDGEETLVCIEETQECGHTGNPCPDDANLCNGEEVCDEDADQCTQTGDPCSDDGLFCNGGEFCDPTKVDCQHSGNPCDEDETCDEPTDECIPPGDDTPLDDPTPAGEKEDEAGWPEGQVTGGCCGCGDNGTD
ncbi:MAG: hypothetical protein IT350_11320 [Deltaproteobacteria bacterium]|nr:hypothetical protein [Deltaproteobacteria bacterium]